jgi:hypothetical protein
MFKLHVLAVLLLCRLSQSAPIDSSALLDDAADSDNYDIIIDQRQNGTQNFRIKVSGLHIAIPDDRDQHSSSSSSDPNQFALEQFASLLSPTSSSSSSLLSSASSNLQLNDSADDFADLAAFFDWKKKSSDKKKSGDTHGRTKDIPTDVQLADQTKIKVKDIVNDERRKYKLLVGEKYIIPILNFLKKQTEDVKE